MLDTFEETYNDWELDIEGEVQTGFTFKEIEEQVSLIADGLIDFIVVTPPTPISVNGDNTECMFVQICSDQDTDLLHIELSVTNDGEQGAIIYGKNELGPQEVFQIIAGFIAHHKVPSLDDWEIVLDLRPKMESYIKGTEND